MKTNVRLQHDKETGLMTIDSLNKKKNNWIELVVPQDNELYNRLLEILDNTK
jgi:hypothetical protein